MSSYAVQVPLVQPGWLQGPYGQAWFRGLGSLKDSLVDRNRQGQNERFSLVASPDAVGAIAANMGIDAGFSETAAALRARLPGAFTTWTRAGSAWGLLEQLVAQGYSNVTVVTQAGIYYSTPIDPVAGPVVTIPSPGSSLTLNPGGFWNVFWVIFTTPFPSNWTSIATPLSSSTAPSIDELNRIRTTINNRRPGHAFCTGITAFTSGELWDYPPGLWSDAGTWNPGTVATTWSATIGSTT